MDIRDSGTQGLPWISGTQGIRESGDMSGMYEGTHKTDISIFFEIHMLANPRKFRSFRDSLVFHGSFAVSWIPWYSKEVSQFQGFPGIPRKFRNS